MCPPIPHYIVSQTVYTDDSPGGPIVDTINNSGVDTRTISDLAGRTVRTIQNFDGLPYGTSNGTTTSGFTSSGNVLPIAANMSQDITTVSVYDNCGRLVASTAYNVTGSTTSPVLTAETTQYQYGSPIEGLFVTAEIDPDSHRGKKGSELFSS